MNPLRNEKGFALAFVLILAAIALVMTLGMLFMVGRGSYVSGQQLRYRTAVEAARGGVEAAVQMVVNPGSGEVVVMSIPYLYTIEVLSQSQTNATERSRFSVLYQY